VDEHIPYEEFSTNMKKLNDEQRFVVDLIIYKKHKYPSKPLHIFLIGGARIGGKNYIIVYHTKHVKIIYKRHSKC
jgi:hypothetical protein